MIYKAIFKAKKTTGENYVIVYEVESCNESVAYHRALKRFIEENPNDLMVEFVIKKIK